MNISSMANLEPLKLLGVLVLSIIYTLFIRIVAAATINFSRAWVRLLIEGGSYLRAAFINFGPIPHSVIRKNCSTEDWFMKTSLRVIDVRSSIKLLCCSRTELRLSSAIVCPNERVHFTCDRDHTHLIDFAHACSYYSRAATISFTELQVWLLFEGGYYSRCSFYSNKYGM